MLYSMSQQLDYPSVGQLKQSLERNKIGVIFAVTDDQYDNYDVKSRLYTPLPRMRIKCFYVNS